MHAAFFLALVLPLVFSTDTCNLPHWKLVVETDFSNGNLTGWTELGTSSSVPPVHECQGHRMLGGNGRLGKGTGLRWSVKGLPTFTASKVSFRFWFLNSWDGEVAWVKINGDLAWRGTHYWDSNAKGETVCDFGFETASPLNHDTYTDVDLFWGSDDVATATNALEVEFGTTLDQAGSDEAFALSFFRVSVIDTHPKQLLSVDFSQQADTNGWRERNADGGSFSPPPVGECGSHHMLGGPARLGAGAQLDFNFDTEEYFSTIHAKATFWFIDSWDGESAYLMFNNVKIPFWKKAYNYTMGNAPVCISAIFPSNAPTNYDTSAVVDVWIVMEVPINHGVFRFGTTLDQPGRDESFAISTWEVNILPECGPPSVKDVDYDCHEGDLVLVQLETTDSDDVYVRIFSLPSKGQLYHWTAADKVFKEDVITQPNTLLNTREHRLYYRAYTTFEGDHRDFFSFRSEYEGGTSSNEGFARFRIFEGVPKPTNTTGEVPYKAVLGFAFVLIALLLIVLIIFGFFLCRREESRREMMGMFFTSSVIDEQNAGNNNNNDTPQENANEGSGDEASVSLSGSS